MSGSEQQDLTYDLDLLESSRRKWLRSAPLRTVYRSLFEAIFGRLTPGSSLELGSGIGNSKEFIPGVVTSDLVKTEYVDMACSAYNIPVHGEVPWNNILAVDVLHHLCSPMQFFESASKALAHGGRIVLIEPAATSYGKIFYRLFHSEPIDTKSIVSPFEFFPDSTSGEFANMGMGEALFVNHKDETGPRLSNLSLEVLEVSHRDFLAYPLSGGYSGPQLAPEWLIRLLLRIEGLLPERILKFIGLRMIIVIGKE